MRLRNRTEAGKLLAQSLEKYRGGEVVVYALPRGGVVLGMEVAKHLSVPLDLVIPRKVGHPLSPEYAVCAVTEDGHLVCNEAEIAGLDQAWLDKAVKKEQAEAKRRLLYYLSGRPAVPVKGKTAIIVDDGVATGLTMLAAIKEVKDRQPAKTTAAVPVIPADTARQLQSEVDEVVALDAPEAYLGAVGAYYDEFEQLSDEEVVQMLRA